MNFFSNKKRFLVLGTTAILLSLTFFFYSCEKEMKGTEQTLEDSSERMKKVVLSTYNQKLLDDFLANTKQYLKSSDLNSRTAYYMMQFTSESGYNSYNLALDNLSDQWDNTNGQQIPAGDDFLILDNPGDPAFNAVDYSLGFQSTRYDYAYNGQFDRNWNTFDPEVTDYDFQRVMNLNEEVQIGSYIYKQVEDGIIVKIPSYNSTGLSAVREYGQYAVVTDMEILDENSGQLSTRGGPCTSKLKLEQEPNSTNVTASPTVFALVEKTLSNGTKIQVLEACGSTFLVNFGDGTGNFNSKGGSLTHTYEVPFGTAKEFTVTAVATTAQAGCTSCNGTTFTNRIQVTNLEPCHLEERHEKKKFIDFTAVNSGVNVPACITAKFGFRGKSASFIVETAQPKVWLNTYFEIRKNGSWRSATPGVPIKIEINGVLKTNGCATSSPVNFVQESKCTSDELLKTPGDVPSFFGVSENLSQTLFGKVTFGPIVYNKDFWHWDN